MINRNLMQQGAAPNEDSASVLSSEKRGGYSISHNTFFSSDE